MKIEINRRAGVSNRFIQIFLDSVIFSLHYFSIFYITSGSNVFRNNMRRSI